MNPSQTEYYSKEAIEERRLLRQFMKECKEFLREINQRIRYLAWKLIRGMMLYTTPLPQA